MSDTKLEVVRRPLRLRSDPTRVIARLFLPDGDGRVDAIIERVLALSEDEVSNLLRGVLTRYTSRHKNIERVFELHYGTVAHRLNGRSPVSADRRALLGAYFTSEYSLESVALFNPSMVLHPDQRGTARSATRFILSLRACGEGHISSIAFRSGTLDESGSLRLDAVTRFAASERPVDDHLHDKNRFFLKLKEMSAYRPIVEPVVQRLRDEFTIDELGQAIEDARRHCGDVDTFDEVAEAMRWLAHSSYRLEFPVSSAVSERVIFPVTENESRGIEDARFVRFRHEDGRIVYYATCTAYNGFRSLPQIIETVDFARFRINTINGRCAQNKGMALFPRKIADRYVMMSRLDGENIYVLRSDDIHFWHEGEKIHGPVQPWEFVQVGNCGSPLETPEGWLLLTHGVGPMREYWIGALLLDLEDPSRVIGRLKEPMLVPTEEERDGYVPNVVYSCGGMIHAGELIIPYGISDTWTGIATVNVSELLSHLIRG